MGAVEFDVIFEPRMIPIWIIGGLIIFCLYGIGHTLFEIFEVIREWSQKR